MDAEEIKERIAYFKNHLTHLNENAHRLNFDFVQEERESLDKIISELEEQLLFTIQQNTTHGYSKRME